MIKFEKVDPNSDVKLPKRGSKFSAGYDFFAPEDFMLAPKSYSTVIWTGVKVQIPGRLWLDICNRSSLCNANIFLSCSGVIDADYYDNPSTHGNIGVSFRNDNDYPVIIRKGDKMCQGIIMSYYVTDNDEAMGERTGGFGSTGR